MLSGSYRSGKSQGLCLTIVTCVTVLPDLCSFYLSVVFNLDKLFSSEIARDALCFVLPLFAHDVSPCATLSSICDSVNKFDHLFVLDKKCHTFTSIQE